MSRVKVVNLSGFKASMLRLGSEFEEAVEKGLALTSQEVRTAAIRGIQDKSPGKKVQRQRQGGKGTYSHVAASAGYAPNTDTGNLVSSIQTERVSPLQYRVGSTSKAEYAEWLEFGTKNMKARPWLQPAFEEKRTALKSNIIISVNEAIRRLKK